jgi:plastocyanin
MSRISVLVVAIPVALSLSWAAQIPVSIVDFSFSPESVQVNPGDSVLWTNNGTYTHTSTSGVNGVWDSLWDSGNLTHGATFVHGFPASGKFRYFCRHHYSGGMTGVVVVRASGVNEAPGTGRNSAALAALPNPFRGSTRIAINPCLSSLAPISADIYDASGRLIRVLPVPRPSTPAPSSVTWDGKDGRGQEAGPGVYFCRYGSGALAMTRLH